jgi:hypothetical protein
MKLTITESGFRDEFKNFDRKDNFSYEGLGALFAYLEELEECSGQEFELDVIGLCCDFTEYADLKEFQEAYSAEKYPTIESIADETTVIRVNEKSFIVHNL